MKWRNPTLVLLVLCTGSLQAVPAEEARQLRALNDATAFLAGIDLPHEADHPLTATAAWKTHVSNLDQDFQKHLEGVLIPLSEWSSEEIPSSLIQGHTVRYLFSGPDILHAFFAFPSADSFILCGLEPVGEIPVLERLTEANAEQALSEVRNSLSAIINFSFFRTNDMKEDLQFATFRGTTPLMMIFLTRYGQYIKGIEFLKLNADGTLAGQGLEPAEADGVKIEFSPRRLQQTKTLYYFSTDLSDGGFAKSGFQSWLETQPKGNSYLKAASFLMHRDWFGKVRSHLLDYSFQIVGDDSGIPFRFFKPDEWDTHLYGAYSGPIELFADYPQSDLQAAYRTGAKPLAFGTGYKWRRGESNLMRFVRRDAPVGEEVGKPDETVAEVGNPNTAEEGAANPVPSSDL